MIELRMSDIKQYLECPRKHTLIKHLGAKEVFEQQVKMSTADIGTLTHAGMADYYTHDGASVGFINAIDLEALRMCQERSQDPDLFYGTNGVSIAMSKIMVARYASWAGERDEDALLDVPNGQTEVRLEVQWSEGITLVGHADYIATDMMFQAPAIFDHKSVANLKQVPRPNDFQLIHYAWMWWKMTGEVPAYAGHNMLKRVGAQGKGPYTHRAIIDINEEMLKHHGRKLVYIIDHAAAFLSLDLHLANQTGECSWKCRVKDLCDVMDDPQNDWKNMAETIYHVERNKLEVL